MNPQTYAVPCYVCVCPCVLSPGHICGSAQLTSLSWNQAHVYGRNSDPPLNSGGLKIIKFWSIFVHTFWIRGLTYG